MSRTTCFIYEEDIPPQLLQTAYAKNNNIIFFVQYNSNRPQEVQLNYIYAGNLSQTFIANNPRYGNTNELIVRQLVFRNIIPPKDDNTTYEKWLNNIFLKHQAAFSPEEINITSPINYKPQCTFLKPPISPASPVRRVKTQSPLIDHSVAFFESAKPSATLKKKSIKESKFNCLECVIS
ncbi:MAG: hypothetical protein A3E82_04745 [Gammaproteobacteria bacterium RIFCSPHIGHO2_12_FULL_38_11]|nr:MAG: hypothetical protein A3E82_04745 [Gammaproteobacteria bacterium RIFCSPHIGHO2_12_FULL_38_11]